MSSIEWKRIRVDWQELEEAFADSASEHRYYLDRETGAVHFFSSYLDKEEEEDERAITLEERYALIPPELRHVRNSDIALSRENLEARIKSWLSEVSVEPL